MPFQIIREDITKIRADAIVNTANPEPACGDGTDKAIYQAAGWDRLLARRRKIGRIEVGQAAATPAFALKARYILHTVGPLWEGGNQGEEEKLRSCYENCLKLAKERKCRSIAFPLISTGVYGYPKAQALQAAVEVFRKFLEKEEMLIYLAVFDKESFGLSSGLFAEIDSYIDENYVGERLAAEYAVQRASMPFAERRSRQMVFGQENCFPEAGAAPKANRSLQAGEPGEIAPFEAVREKSVGGPAAAEAAQKQEPAGNQKLMSAGGAKSQRSSVKRSLEDVVAQVGETFQERLFRLIDQRGLEDVEVYKRANLDRKLFSKIRRDAAYRPKKGTALALAVALKLNLDETKDLLLRAGFALSPSSKSDLIIEYFIERQVYDIIDINLALFEYEQPALGSW